jgi:hypothetical protein
VEQRQGTQGPADDGRLGEQIDGAIGRRGFRSSPARKVPAGRLRHSDRMSGKGAPLKVSSSKVLSFSNEKPRLSGALQ